MRDFNRSTINNYGTATTTNTGLLIDNDDRSLKAGIRGPTIMQDFHLREKIQHFDWERMPERVVHARGSAAHGYFQTYKNHSALTNAKLFHDPSVKIPMFVRFSQVLGSLGATDLARDVRGFALRFYTEQGNWDIVGNNIPVFFIQDAIKFPDLIHALKPEPHTGVPQGSSAHDNAWDFLSLSPEAAHVIMWALSSRGIPRSYRMMEGFGIHSFFFINSEGKARFVKFHWKPLSGLASLLWDEAQTISGKNSDFLRDDLYQAIDRGDFPEYEFGIQIVELQNENDFEFDLLDPTKIIPEEIAPFIPLGKIVLDRNPDNFFSETEQVTFHPGNIVQGIDVTDDPLLQGRLFSYTDTQLSRHRSPNYLDIPINRHLSKTHNNQRDGNMQLYIFKGRTNYFPNSLGGNTPKPTPAKQGGFHDYPLPVSGVKTRDRAKKFADFYSQARLFYNSLTVYEKQQLIDGARFELGKVKSQAVRDRMVHLLNNVDNNLARNVAEAIAVAPPEPVFEPENKTTKGLSIDKYPKLTIRTRQVAVLVADGVDGDSTLQVISNLRDAGVYITVVAPTLGPVRTSGNSNDSLVASDNFITTASALFDAVFIADGKVSVDTLVGFWNNGQNAENFVTQAFDHAKPIAALGEGIRLLPERASTNSTSNSVASNEGVVTSSNPDQLDQFIAKFKNAILQGRFWERLSIDLPH